MELILINESKLKIMLSPDDMKEYEIDCQSVDYKSTETRRAFWSILDRVKQETGFDAASERVYIQMYPSRDGGCEMYVTKLGFSGDGKRKERSERKEKQGNASAFVFFDITSLLNVCRALSVRRVEGESSAYVDKSGQCMLFFTPKNETLSLKFIEEFGDKTDPTLSFAFANEHLTCICEQNAVDILKDFA
jgi:negative regulator of genetic competence, sporulation and motility